MLEKLDRVSFGFRSLKLCILIGRNTDCTSELSQSNGNRVVDCNFTLVRDRGRGFQKIRVNRPSVEVIAKQVIGSDCEFLLVKFGFVTESVSDFVVE